MGHLVPMASIIASMTYFMLSPITHWFLLTLWILTRNRKKQNCGAQSLLLLFYIYLVAASPLPQYLISNLESSYPPMGDRMSKPEAVVVLGGGVIHYDPKSHQFHMTAGIDRLLEAIRIQKSYSSVLMYFSGFSKNSQAPWLYDEAPSMKALATDLGLPAENIVIENKSFNTNENAREMGKILKAGQIKKFYLVTSAYHMGRAMACFKKQGLNPIAYPVDYRMLAKSPQWLSGWGIKNMRHWKHAIHEYIGTIYYSIRGFL